MGWLMRTTDHGLDECCQHVSALSLVKFGISNKTFCGEKPGHFERLVEVGT